MEQQPQAMGTLVREYELLESLGAGGMGEVFKARHTLLDAHFAVKVIHRDLTKNPEIRARFLQEAKFLARLDHPGIMRLRNVFEEGERLYIVTDYLKGETLGRVLSRAGAVPLEDGMDWLYQIAAGVEYAHKCGVVHRDLKPANIMVLDNGSLQILDFGLAKQFDADTGGVTTQDQFLGTPPYIPPEVLKGEVKLRDIGPEADVYALGVIAYRIFGGVLPFRVEENDSPLRQLSLLIRRHVDGAPVEPLTALRPDLPADFSACVQRVLVSPQVERPRSAKAFIEMLIRCSACTESASWHGGAIAVERPVTREIPHLDAPPAPQPATLPPTDLALEPPSRGSRRALIVVAALVILAAAAAAWFLYFNKPPPPPVAGLTVRVQPDDARISVDGAVVSRSSLHEDKALGAGRHEIVVEKRGYKAYRETIDAAAGATIDRLIMLQKATGTLAIVTDPPGAAVTLDGTPLPGVTPLEAAGVQADVEHTVVARLPGPGREPATAAAAVPENGRQELTLSLRGGPATLDVETTPDEVGIWLDEEYVGTSPAEIDNLEADREIAVRLSRAGYESAVVRVNLAPGEKKKIVKALARKGQADEAEPAPAREKAPPKEESRVLVVENAPKSTGFISAEASPAAYVYVDGKFTGRSTPVIGHPLPAGGHTVTLRLPDGREQLFNVQIKTGETIRVIKDF